jgi:predicted DNA-binding helix-hairpin-helix protein
MDLFDRLQDLSSQTQFEPAEEKDCPSPVMRKRVSDAVSSKMNVSHAVMPNGRQISLLKTLLTSACERDCYYCPFRAGRDFRRTTMKPDEMAQVFSTMARAGLVEGMFLSSGIAGGGIRSQDLLIDTAEILRQKHAFRGYLHLKVMPGAEYGQVERAMQLADRVSINLEAPNSERLEMLAPHKAFFDELVKPLHWMSEIRARRSPSAASKNRWPSLTTQFVIGAVGESDLEVLKTTEYLHKEVRLERAYFSAFKPVPDTPLENLPPASPLRELHLYQASFLLRDYGFELEDLPFEPSGALPAGKDPKLAWAQQNLTDRPIEINLADRHDLLKVPGIGLKGASEILRSRRKGTISDLSDLHKIGINTKRVMPFILLNGKQPARQLTLFSLD